MSLRARIEAVIYAAEEPVTLAQLTSVFAEEALAERSERLARTALEDTTETSSAAEPAALFTAQALAPPEAFATAETAADNHSEHDPKDHSKDDSKEDSGEPVSAPALDQAVEHPDQVAATQSEGSAGDRRDAADTALEQARVARIRAREAREEIRRTLDELIEEYDRGNRGVEIREIAGGYRVATRPEYHDAVRGFVKSLKPPMKLTLQALETLAVIAYKQPVTAPEVSEIRGVDSGGVLGSLISRKLVTTAGRKQVIGRPILYKTTKEFLLRFGLKDIAELPSMEEFEKMAGELAEPDPVDQQSPASPRQTSAAQLPLPEPGTTEDAIPAADYEEPSMHPVQQPEPDQPEMPSEFASADLQASPRIPEAPELAEPELAEPDDDEQIAATARANIQVDDESDGWSDLPGVTRDTAGRVNIDSAAWSHKPGLPSEDH